MHLALEQYYYEPSVFLLLCAQIKIMSASSIFRWNFVSQHFFLEEVPSLSRSLRSVMMDLLGLAYINCEPRKAISCPNYIRLWTEISAGPAKYL